MLAAFQQYGLRPGPLLFQSKPDLVWGMIASLYIGNALLLILNFPLIGIWVRLLTIPRPWLFAGILCFSIMGAYTLNTNVVDVAILLAIGLAGFAMRLLHIPLVPCLIGLILGPLLETQFRRSLMASLGDPSIFFTRPISLGLLLIAAAVLVIPLLMRARRPAAAR